MNKKDRPSFITLHVPMLDYATITTFDLPLYDYWYDLAAEQSYDQQAVRWAQYKGVLHQVDGGSLWLGKGLQRGERHYLIRVSGEASDTLRYALAESARKGARIRRLDLQVTIQEPDGWSQFDRLTELKNAGRTVGWQESKSKSKQGLQTVYVGSRTSDRFCRMYVKLSDAGVRLLRLEVEYKKERAEAVFAKVASGDMREAVRGFLLHEMGTTLRNDRIERAFSRVLYGDPETVRIKLASDAQRTAEWLLNMVLPTFWRHVNAHGDDYGVRRAYSDALESVSRGDGYDE